MKIGYSKKELSFRAFICAFVLTAAFYVTSFAGAAQSVRSECVRLHILANSDDEKDQELKLKVRDELLSSGFEIFSGSTDIKEIEKELLKSENELIAAALKIIKNEGFDYKVTINMCDEYFTTRSYGKYTMPAGKYKAVKVIIGEGKGQNWWCVMFPPLCLPGFSETEPESFLTENGSKLIQEKPVLEPRFILVEWFERLCDKIG